MVAYNNEGQFVPRIEDGTKQFTIRKVGKRRHARAGEMLQLYTGQRTSVCKKIADVRCTYTKDLLLHFELGEIIEIEVNGTMICNGLDDFARHDGFSDLQEMTGYWRVKFLLRHERYTGRTVPLILVGWGPDLFFKEGFNMAKRKKIPAGNGEADPKRLLTSDEEKPLPTMEDNFEQDPDLVKLGDRYKSSAIKKSRANKAFARDKQNLLTALREKKSRGVRIMIEGNEKLLYPEATWKIKQKSTGKKKKKKKKQKTQTAN